MFERNLSTTWLATTGRATLAVVKASRAAALPVVAPRSSLCTKVRHTHTCEFWHLTPARRHGVGPQTPKLLPRFLIARDFFVVCLTDSVAMMSRARAERRVHGGYASKTITQIRSSNLHLQHESGSKSQQVATCNACAVLVGDGLPMLMESVTGRNACQARSGNKRHPNARTNMTPL